MVELPRREKPAAKAPPLPLPGIWAILLFLILAAAFAILLHLAVGGDQLPIGLYLVGILALALLFPRLFGAADKEYVDLLYYGTGMAIAALVFVSKEVERQRIGLNEEIAAVTVRLAAAEADIATFDAAVAAAPTLRPWLDGQIEDAFVVTEQEERRQCGCAVAGPFAGAQCGGGITPSLPTAQDRSALRAHQQVAQALCTQYGDMLRDAAPDRDPVPRDLAATLRVAKAISAGGVLTLGTRSLSLGQVADLLQQIAGGPEAARGGLVDRRAQIAQDGDRAQTAYRAAGAQFKTGVALVAGEITEFYWPYILIAYLGLKIARVDYGAKLRR